MIAGGPYGPHRVLCTVFLGQKLGFSTHTLELNVAYFDNWLRVLRSDKRRMRSAPATIWSPRWRRGRVNGPREAGNHCDCDPWGK
jgi:hypothetical protein